MYHSYYYTFRCGHREYFSSQHNDATHPLGLAAQHIITSHSTTGLDLGYPGYACSTCQALNEATSSEGHKDSADTDCTIMTPSESTVRHMTAILGSNSRREDVLPPRVGESLGRLNLEEVVNDWVKRQWDLVVEQFNEDLMDEMNRTARLKTSFRGTGVAATSNTEQRNNGKSDQQKAMQACNTARPGAGSRNLGSANTPYARQPNSGRAGQQGESSSNVSVEKSHKWTTGNS